MEYSRPNNVDKNYRLYDHYLLKVGQLIYYNTPLHQTQWEFPWQGGKYCKGHRKAHVMNISNLKWEKNLRFQLLWANEILSYMTKSWEPMLIDENQTSNIQ